MFILAIFQLMVAVQMFFGYGTAYRLTKRGSDNGVALFGWLFVMGLASVIPGLGIYLWYRYRDIDQTDSEWHKDSWQTGRHSG